MKPQPYMGVAEVAEYLGMSKQSVYNYSKRGKYFPAPCTRLRCGPVWNTEDIVKYKETKDGSKKVSG